MENKILGIIKTGQLKRIQSVLHREWRQKNQFINRNWEEEIGFILKGKGQFLPINIVIDFITDDLMKQLKYEIIKSNDKGNSIEPTKTIEKILKLLVMQKNNYILSNPK